VIASRNTVLKVLLSQAGLPDPQTVRPMMGRGFDTDVCVVTFTDGRQCVMRHWREQRKPELPRAAFLESQGVPAPRLLAGTADASLYEFADGTLLGDLIEAGRCTEATWYKVGRAYRRVHDVRFPARLSGVVEPDRIVVHPVDPVDALHSLIEESVPGLRRRLPDVIAYLPEMHRLLDHAAQPLRTATTALGHGDINMWNIIIGEQQAWLIDWDSPRIGDPAVEVALLDKHASLFDERGLDPSFFAGYGHPPSQPNTFVHRVIQTMSWAADEEDWIDFEQAPHISEDLRVRARRWLPQLLAYVERMPEHLQELRTLLRNP
jgi:aminoglycoside phosphotransferase (APT) family kinase protein